ILGAELVDSLVDSENFLMRRAISCVGLVQRDLLLTPAMLVAMFTTGLLDQNPPHGLGGGGEEVAPAVPVLGPVNVHQAEIGFVNQGGSLKGLPWVLLGQLPPCQFAQLMVDKRQELLGGVRIALLDGGQDASDFA